MCGGAKNATLRVEVNGRIYEIQRRNILMVFGLGGTGIVIASGSGLVLDLS
jgi:hypothetical protein